MVIELLLGILAPRCMRMAKTTSIMFIELVPIDGFRCGFCDGCTFASVSTLSLGN